MGILEQIYYQNEINYEDLENEIFERFLDEFEDAIKYKL